MENVWVLAAVWVGLALIATLVAIWFRISTAHRDLESVESTLGEETLAS